MNDLHGAILDTVRPIIIAEGMWHIVGPVFIASLYYQC